tara:strand:- start:123 stop:470 length:348 start_codon:yes stop_codon:yes gene_type:complete
MLIPNFLHADEGLNLSCKNLLSAFGRHYEPLNFKLEVTGFHYFDENHNKFKVIPSKDLEYGEDRFTAKFPEYELGFQRIVFAGDTKPTITMSKYDHVNNKFLDHYECTVVKSYIN